MSILSKHFRPRILNLGLQIPILETFRRKTEHSSSHISAVAKKKAAAAFVRKLQLLAQYLSKDVNDVQGIKNNRMFNLFCDPSVVIALVVVAQCSSDNCLLKNVTLYQYY